MKEKRADLFQGQEVWGGSIYERDRLARTKIAVAHLIEETISTAIIPWWVGGIDEFKKLDSRPLEDIAHVDVAV
jgi:hypothetical protein